MSKHNELGKDAEILAVNFLKKMNYHILATNYRYGHKEIDIIARDNEIIVFVEVKYRKNNVFGYPESFVNEKKRQNIIVASQYYMDQFAELIQCRYDIISITKSNSEILHIQDAFY